MTRCISLTLPAIAMGIRSSSCAHHEPPSQPAVTQAAFGTAPDGQAVQVYTLRNANGVEARVTNYGGVILSLKVPDRNGALADVVLGYDALHHYVASSPYFGALIGRYGNRIRNGEFSVDGSKYVLAKNNGPHHLHGGVEGFDKVVWHAETFTRPDSVGIVLRYTSRDGEEGYPGTLRAQVKYTLTNENQLIFDYAATTDKATPVNLTQHSYFNLAGDGTRDILSHVVRISADRFTPVDATLIPTGELRPVRGTPFDFTSPHAIGARITHDDEQLKFGLGYDHNFVLNRPNDTDLVLAAEVVEPVSGRVMEIFTTELGLQFYSGNFLDGTLTGKGGVVYKHRNGFAMETQHFPDSPNQTSFPSTILRPGQEYRTKTIYKFSTRP